MGPRLPGKVDPLALGLESEKKVCERCRAIRKGEREYG